MIIGFIIKKNVVFCVWNISLLMNNGNGYYYIFFYEKIVFCLWYKFKNE